MCQLSRPVGPDGIGPVQPSHFLPTGKRPDPKHGQEPGPGPGPGPANGTGAAAAPAASKSSQCRTPIRGETPTALSEDQGVFIILISAGLFFWVTFYSFLHFYFFVMVW